MEHGTDDGNAVGPIFYRDVYSFFSITLLCNFFPHPQVRKEQQAALAAAVRRAEAAKGQAWAAAFLDDVKRVQWFDACVAENPAVGPKVAA